MSRKLALIRAASTVSNSQYSSSGRRRKSKPVTLAPVDLPFLPPPDAVREPLVTPRERGLAISSANAHSPADHAERPLDLAWLVRFKLPFSWAVSKNSLYGRGKPHQKAVFLRKDAAVYRDSIAFLAKNAMKGIDLKNDRLWIDIFVEKPQQRGDAVNVVDLVCDAIKRAIPLDDRWYSIRRLDWSVKKSNQHLFIGLAQEVGATDSKVCSLCGCIRPLADFTNYKTSTCCRFGKGNICITCRAPSYDKGPNKKYREATA